MMKPSKTFTSPVMDALGVDPKQLELPIPSSWDAVVAAIHEAIPYPPPCVSEFVMCSDLVSGDGNNISSDYSLCPQNYDHPSPQYGRIDCGPPYSPTLSLSLSPSAIFSSPLYSPTTDASSLSSPPAFAPSPSSPTTFALPSSTSPARVLVEAPCAEGIPIRQGGGYTCSICNEPFKRRDDAKRHIKSAGMRVSCKYCGKPGSRRDSRARHLKSGTCQKAWEAGYKAGRFTDWSVEDAYN